MKRNILTDVTTDYIDIQQADKHMAG